MRLSIIFLFVFSTISFSQIIKDSCTYSVRGQVLDLQTKEPLPFAEVRIENTTRGSATNENGIFTIEHLCEREVHLVVSFVGYKTTIHHHDLHHPSPKIFLAPDQFILESVIIEAEHEPAGFKSIATSELSETNLTNYRSDNLGDALKNISGLSTISTGQNIVKPVIHGLHSNRVLIINNGIRHEFQNWGVEHAPEIDASQAERIEVLKGASTVQYGADALGGVILVQPKKFELHTPLQGSIGLEGRTNGRSGEINANLNQGYERLSWTTDFGATQQGDLHAPDYMLTNTGKKEWSASAGLRYHLHSADIEAYYSHFFQNLGILRGSVNGSLEDLELAISEEPPLYTEPFKYTINNPQQEVTHDLLKLKSTFFGERNSFLFQYGYQNNLRKEFDVRRGTNNEIPAIDLQLKTHNLEGIWYHPEADNHSGSVGIQFQFQDNKNIFGTNTISFVPNYTQTRAGIFAIESWVLASSTLEAGVRYDYQYNSIIGLDAQNMRYADQFDFNNLTATLGWIKQLNTTSTYRTNIGTAWRAPNVSELYAYGRHQSIFDYGFWRYEVDASNNVNTDIPVLSQSEKPVHSEKGFKWLNTLTIQKEKADLELTGYVNLIQNYFYSQPAGITSNLRGVFPFFIWKQDDALFWGLDASATFQLHARIQSEVKGSYVWAQQIESKDVFVGIPPPVLSYQLNVNPFSSTKITSQLQLVFDYTLKQNRAPRVISVTELIDAGETGSNIFTNDPSNFDILAAPEDYLLTHVFWNTELRKFSFSVQFRNLFNVSYRNYMNRLRYYADETGFNAIIRVSYKL